MTKIYLIKNLINGDVRFDLKAEGLPANFLGLAADLKFRSDAGKVAFEKMDWGKAISSLKELPIKMATFQDGKLIVGMTFRSANLPKVSDGVLASFYFRGQAIEFEGFERTVLSKFDGKRVDLTDVKWEVAHPSALASAKTPPLTEKAQAAEIPTELSHTAEPWQEILANAQPEMLDSKPEWWGDQLWLLLAIILGVILLIFGLTIGKLRLKSRG